MSYTKHTWTNDELPALNGDNLNNMEQGIKEAHDNFANYKLLEDFAIITGNFTLVSGKSDFTVNYPIGFNSENCVVISTMVSRENGYTEGYYPTAVGYTVGALGKGVHLNSSNIRLMFCNPTEDGHSSGTATFTYKIVLMKTSEEES